MFKDIYQNVFKFNGVAFLDVAIKVAACIQCRLEAHHYLYTKKFTKSK